jgi:hypothetical protein
LSHPRSARLRAAMAAPRRPFAPRLGPPLSARVFRVSLPVPARPVVPLGGWPGGRSPWFSCPSRPPCSLSPMTFWWGERETRPQRRGNRGQKRQDQDRSDGRDRHGPGGRRAGAPSARPSQPSRGGAVRAGTAAPYAHRRPRSPTWRRRGRVAGGVGQVAIGELQGRPACAAKSGLVVARSLKPGGTLRPPHVGQPDPLVRLLAVAFHSCPSWHLHNIFRLLPAVTPAGFQPAASAASSGRDTKRGRSTRRKILNGASSQIAPTYDKSPAPVKLRRALATV